MSDSITNLSFDSHSSRAPRVLPCVNRWNVLWFTNCSSSCACSCLCVTAALLWRCYGIAMDVASVLPGSNYSWYQMKYEILHNSTLKKDIIAFDVISYYISDWSKSFSKHLQLMITDYNYYHKRLRNGGEHSRAAQYFATQVGSSTVSFRHNSSNTTSITLRYKLFHSLLCCLVGAGRCSHCDSLPCRRYCRRCSWQCYSPWQCCSPWHCIQRCQCS